MGLNGTWMGDHLGTPGAAYKNQRRAPVREHVSQADGRQTLSRHTSSGKVWTVLQTACWQLLQSGLYVYCPLKWGLMCGAMKMAKSCQEEDLGQKVTGSKLGASKDFSLWNPR